MLAFVLAAWVMGGLGSDRVHAEDSLALAHYMPWFSADEVEGRWGYHWTMNHFDPSKMVDGRRQIASARYPLAGIYDSGDPHVLEYHVLLMRIAGIDGVIVDWYGLTDLHDYRINHNNTIALIEQLDRFEMKFAICYEDQTLAELVKNGRIKTHQRVQHVAEEIRWMQENWFSKPNYVSLEGKPILLSFGNTGLDDQEWSECLKTAGSDAHYFSEHTRRDSAAGAFDWPVPSAGLNQIEQFYQRRVSWPQFLPCAYPRFDDYYQESQVNAGYPLIPDDDGDTLRKTLSAALKSKPSILQIVTWNDWGEGTQVEPSREHGYRDLELIQKQLLAESGSTNSQRVALTLPLRLLELRRENPSPDVQLASRLSKVAQNLASGQYDIAKRQIEFLESRTQR